MSRKNLFGRVFSTTLSSPTSRDKFRDDFCKMWGFQCYRIPPALHHTMPGSCISKTRNSGTSPSIGSLASVNFGCWMLYQRKNNNNNKTSKQANKQTHYLAVCFDNQIHILVRWLWCCTSRFQPTVRSVCTGYSGTTQPRPSLVFLHLYDERLALLPHVLLGKGPHKLAILHDLAIYFRGGEGDIGLKHEL